MWRAYRGASVAGDLHPYRYSYLVFKAGEIERQWPYLYVHMHGKSDTVLAIIHSPGWQQLTSRCLARPPCPYDTERSTQRHRTTLETSTLVRSLNYDNRELVAITLQPNSFTFGISRGTDSHPYPPHPCLHQYAICLDQHGSALAPPSSSSFRISQSPSFTS